MARLEAATIVSLTTYCFFHFYFCCGIYAAALKPIQGNWTWREATFYCRKENARLAYKDEIIAVANMSDSEILEDDILWINDNRWPSEIKIPCGCLETIKEDGDAVFQTVRNADECAMCCKDFPLFALKKSQCLCKANSTGPLNCTTCDDPNKYQLYKHIEPPEQCLLMYGTKYVYNAKFVNCSTKAGIMCRTAVVKAMKGTRFTWSDAQTLCLNASSKLVNLNMVSDLERSRSIDVLNNRHYWANGVVKYGQAEQFQIVDCVESSGISGSDETFPQYHLNSVFNCNQMCQDSGSIALMGENCRCLMEDENVTDWRTTGCTNPCFGNTRDRCGGNNSYSIYRRILTEPAQQSDVCLAITKKSDSNVTTHWLNCQQGLDGCICRNNTGINDASFVIIGTNITWTEAQEECESKNTILSTLEANAITEDQLSNLQVGVTLWTGVYSPTVLDFNSFEIQDGDKCLSVTNFKKPDFDTEERDCNQLQGVICHNDEGVLLDITTLPYDHMMTDKTSPDVTTEHVTTSSITTTTTSSPYTGMSPMIIGLIVTVVLVGLVLAIILGVLTVLLYRFKEQKRQLNMLKGPTISYSNLEHSIVVSYNGAPSNEDSGEDMGNLDNITEQLDAQFMRKDELSPDENSEHLYDISDNFDNKPSIKSENGILNAGGITPPKPEPEPEDDAYTEVELCEETGNPTIVSNCNSDSCRNSSSSGKVKNLENSTKEERVPLLKVTENCNESFDKLEKRNSKETCDDDEYADADSCVRRCSKEIDIDNTYDELENKSRKRPKSNDTDCMYDRVDSDKYDEIKTGVAAKGKVHYEDVDINFDLPSLKQ